MLGAVGVGKTSLVRQYVDSLFSDSYQSTVGVKVDKKLVELPDGLVTLMLWDVYGETERLPVLDAYLQGMDGCLLVVDADRPDTVEMADRVHRRVRSLLGDVPCGLVLNKSDLVADWSAAERASAALSRAALFTQRTSARTGESVEQCFGMLAERLAR